MMNYKAFFDRLNVVIFDLICADQDAPAWALLCAVAANDPNGEYDGMYSGDVIRAMFDSGFWDILESRPVDYLVYTDSDREWTNIGEMLVETADRFGTHAPEWVTLGAKRYSEWVENEHAYNII